MHFFLGALRVKLLASHADFNNFCEQYGLRSDQRPEKCNGPDMDPIFDILIFFLEEFMK